MSSIKARLNSLLADMEYITSTNLPGNKRGLDVAATYVPVALTLVGSVVGLNPSVTTIPRSSSNAILLTTLAADVKSVQTIEDIGEFIALYADAARATLICILPLAGGVIDLGISSGTSLYVGAIKDADITTDTLLNINFLG